MVIIRRPAPVEFQHDDRMMTFYISSYLPDDLLVLVARPSTQQKEGHEIFALLCESHLRFSTHVTLRNTGGFPMLSVLVMKAARIHCTNFGSFFFFFQNCTVVVEWDSEGIEWNGVWL